jgi:predicted nucleotide-binding protein
MAIKTINDLKNAKAAQLKRDVFIVHGHDHALKEAVARFLIQIGLVPIILHEQANAGQTIIEKFESHSKRAIFAIVLLTADDIGGAAIEPRALDKYRARQNVIFELGFFVGILGRKNVCAIYQESVELPSDLNGLLYTAYDKTGKWKYELAKELKDGGVSVDLNKI